MKDLMHIGVVNFEAQWGEKAENLAAMERDIRQAAQAGVEFLLFPEMCLTGYSTGLEFRPGEAVAMPVVLAETVPGPTSEYVAALARETGMYISYGATESISEDPSHAYNVQVVCTPEGAQLCYRKIQPYEAVWCRPGKEPCVLETPWGNIGLQICYDFYEFPELQRYYALRGCRLLLNPTAEGDRPVTVGVEPTALWTDGHYRSRIDIVVDRDGVFTASANLTGFDGPAACRMFPGGSVVAGPDADGTVCHCIGSCNEAAAGLYHGVIDLSAATPAPWRKTAWKPAQYLRWYREIYQQHWNGRELLPPWKKAPGIAVSQFVPSLQNKEETLHRMQREILAAHEAGAALLLFPELALTGGNGAASLALAEPLTGPSVSQIRQWSREYEISVVFGMAEQAGARYYNTAVAVQPDGTLSAYRKIHLEETESAWFTPGDAPCVCEMAFGRVGLLFGFEACNVPEMERYLASRGCVCLLTLNAYQPEKADTIEKLTAYWENRIMNLASRSFRCVATASLMTDYEEPKLYSGSFVATADYEHLYLYGGSTVGTAPGVTTVFPNGPSTDYQVFDGFHTEVYLKLYQELANENPI